MGWRESCVRGFSGETGHCTAQHYVDGILESTMLPFLTNHPNVTTPQQDNARPANARLTGAFLENNINVLPWSASFPDLNSKEHLLDQIGCRVYDNRRRRSNRQKLITALMEERKAYPVQNPKTNPQYAAPVPDSHNR